MQTTTDTDWDQTRQVIEAAWDQPSLRTESSSRDAVESVIAGLDQGVLRCAEPAGGDWQVNEWVKKAVVMYFPMREMKVEEVGPFQFHDKMSLKRNHPEAGVRVLSGLVLGLVPCVILGLFVAAYLQYRRGNQFGI